MRRREFIVGLCGAATMSFAVRAQQPAMPVVGFLRPGSPELNAHLLAAFRKGIGETGYVEGRNVAVEYRWADNDDRLRELAADLVRLRVNVIVTPGSTTAAAAAKSETTTIPIVFSGGGDPVEIGLVASLNRPGGNVTGVSSMAGELGSKRVGLLQELVPRAARLAVLINPNNPLAEAFVADIRAAAPAVGLQLEVLTASTSQGIDAAFATLAHEKVDALFVAGSAFFATRRVQLTVLAASYSVPAIYSQRSFVDAGGLMSYGTNFTDIFRQVGLYTARILKGANPADLPVQQPTKFDLVINLNTARALRLAVPPSLLARADEVIE